MPAFSYMFSSFCLCKLKELPPTTRPLAKAGPSLVAAPSAAPRWYKQFSWWNPVKLFTKTSLMFAIFCNQFSSRMYSNHAEPLRMFSFKASTPPPNREPQPDASRSPVARHHLASMHSTSWMHRWFETTVTSRPVACRLSWICWAQKHQLLIR